MPYSVQNKAAGVKANRPFLSSGLSVATTSEGGSGTGTSGSTGAFAGALAELAALGAGALAAGALAELAALGAGASLEAAADAIGAFARLAAS